jgi:hypothetical protein
MDLRKPSLTPSDLLDPTTAIRCEHPRQFPLGIHDNHPPLSTPSDEAHGRTPLPSSVLDRPRPNPSIHPLLSSFLLFASAAAATAPLDFPSFPFTRNAYSRRGQPDIPLPAHDPRRTRPPRHARGPDRVQEERQGGVGEADEVGDGLWDAHACFESAWSDEAGDELERSSAAAAARSAGRRGRCCFGEDFFSRDEICDEAFSSGDGGSGCGGE